ncbi:hypothetical protein [Priestia endophytica]|uniref:hypothetical protein n=1 Tax=Priestia endophytica TaxID=135735 RepID=UPI00077C3C18|nr:hypothetical protein [Priestia endophytica]KYG30357.1 hypothetical protein AZF06_24790 [Priestia endophytica]
MVEGRSHQQELKLLGITERDIFSMQLLDKKITTKTIKLTVRKNPLLLVSKGFFLLKGIQDKLVNIMLLIRSKRP